MKKIKLSNIKIRRSWKIHPATRVVPNKKKYDRKLNKKDTYKIQKQEEI